MEEIYANVEYVKPVDSRPLTNQTGPRSSERRFHGAVVLCLGLLSVFLLAGLIGLGVHYYDVVRGLTEERDLLNANLTETTEELHQQNSDVIRGLTEERDLLNANLTETTKKLHQLQSLSKQKKTCPAGWTMFNYTCYLISTKSDSWENGRQDCRGRGGDLVVIDSHEEQDFLTCIAKQTRWIGLNDREKEGTWKWTDGTLLTQKYWEKEQPDNGGGDPRWGEEDCVTIRPEKTGPNNWNDLSCDASEKWICEKMP
ncbi:CD209 antigen-like protein E [Scomber japonicus]|uniref:CD209 antigen-like protein E n=1 Tax=Scomber japonicus TaxID=13676 RepID=UPI002305EAC5|nr:CD209 antigen-like protein E [Scomber japonicus]